MKIIALVIVVGSAALAGCAHEMPHEQAPHQEVVADHHDTPRVDHHDAPAPYVAGAVEAEGDNAADAVSHMQSRAATLGADRVIEVVAESIGGGRYRARGRMIRTTH